MTASALWRRLDAPGHDACVLEELNTGWRLKGMAVFRHEGVAAQLAYEVSCDRAWHSQEARVSGWLDTQPADFHIARVGQGSWTLNGRRVLQVQGCVDVDLSFTPATNLFQLRRLALTEGQAADAPAAWLDLSRKTLSLLPQRYERRTDTTYRYAAPTTGYAANLQVTPLGFVRQYPRLWKLDE
jgi:hypothetical protein